MSIRYGHGGAASQEITRPANTTAYAQKDVVAAQFAVSAATNASPIAITTSAAHGLTTGDRVTVASVGGNTAANGSFTVTVTSTTAFTLDGSTGNGTYTSGGIVTPLLRFSGLVRGNGGTGVIVLGRLWTDQKTNVSTYRLHLFAETVDPIADNSPYLLLYTNAAKRIGYIDFPALATEDSSNSTGASAIVTPSDAGYKVPLFFGAASGNDVIWGMLETTLSGGFTPASAQKFTVFLRTVLD
jgi:hypothetical protein